MENKTEDKKLDRVLGLAAGFSLWLGIFQAVIVITALFTLLLSFILAKLFFGELTAGLLIAFMVLSFFELGFGWVAVLLGFLLGLAGLRSERRASAKKGLVFSAAGLLAYGAYWLFIMPLLKSMLD